RARHAVPADDPERLPRLEPVAGLQVVGPGTEIVAGGTMQLTAIARTTAGTQIPGRTVTWTTSDTTLATVSDSGLVQTRRPGLVQIGAAVEGVTASYGLHILEPVASVQITGRPANPVVLGAFLQLNAVARSASGQVLTGRAVAWTSSDSTVARISPFGSVQTLSAGETVITLTVEGRTATFTLRVLEPVAAVQIIGAPLDSLIAGATVQVRAVPRSAAGDSLPDRTVFWMSSNFNVASVSAEGLITTKTAGIVQISATVEGRSASFILYVLEAVSMVTVASPFPGMYETQVLQLTGTPRGASGNPLARRPVAWSSSDPLRATVDSAGRVTGVGAGEVTLSATSEGKTGSVRLVVRPRPAADWTQAASWTTHQGNARHDGFANVTADPVVFRELWARSPLGATALNPVTEGDGRVFVSGYAYFGGQTLAALDARTGTAAWSHPFGTIHGVHPPAFGNGRVYATTSGHEESFLYAFDAASGTVAFREPYANQWSRYLAPVVSGETVFMAGGYYGGMYAFRSTDGEQRWFANTNQYDEWTPAVANGQVYAYTGSYSPMLQVHDAATGAQTYTIADPNFSWNGWSIGGAPVLGSMNNVLVTQGERLVSFNLGTRTVGWERAGTFRGAVTVADGVLYVINNEQVEARRESDGTLLWLWIPPANQRPTGTIVATRNLLFVSTASHTYGIDLAARLVTWSHPAGGHLALGRDGILFIAQESGMLTAVDLK
ncbi:MAG TPA: Ig-like domain-containing protein, partial [Longimicrobium sp.]|nr:Ig-like domain-containing protein [Longimicrobium sp.]